MLQNENNYMNIFSELIKGSEKDFIDIEDLSKKY